MKHFFSITTLASLSMVPLVDSACTTSITSFTLIDAASDTEIGPLPNPYMGSAPLNVRANFKECPGDDIQSVKFFLDGVEVRCENYTPYALFGDENPNGPDLGDFGDFYSGPFAPGGVQVVQAVPYPMKDCTGTPFESLYEDVSTCSECPGAITGFTVVDPLSDTEIGPLSSFEFSEFEGLPLNIRADFLECGSGGIESVLFYLDGFPTRCENYTPYAFFGDHNPNGPDLGPLGDFYEGHIAAGAHEIIAVPFDGPDCSGNAGCPKKEELSVCSYCPAGYTLTTVDFSCSKDGSIDYNHGDYVDDLGFGFNLRVNPGSGGKNVNDPRIYDSDLTGGADPDLEQGLGNLLIVQEDVSPDTPDDNANGGQIIFNFHYPTKVKSIGLVDTEKGTSVLATKSTGLTWRARTAAIPDSTNTEVELDQSKVNTLKISSKSSFGISSIDICVRD